MTPKLFSELGLSEELLKAIDKLGFEQASPIQAAAIPVLMAGTDVVGQSQTGSGKTAAFAIPAIEKTDPTRKVVQVLILCPTRELAVQVSEEVHKLALFKKGIHALPIYGGQSYERQFYGLKQGAQIVIGTPGRVMDHMRRGTLRFDETRLVILDEADVMLNMGFREDIDLILQSAPKERQTVFFSATMPRPIRELIEKHSRNPQNVRIEQKAMTVPTVEQVYYEVDRRFKIELLTRLIDIHDLRLGIIFCNTKRMVDDLVEHLETQGYMAEGLHGGMTQAMRDRVMNKFRKSGLEFLVATDVAARGIDVDDIQVVFNYDLPYDSEDYVHRIGRTGRAGREGRAISFVAGRELFQIRNIERYTNTRIHRGSIPTEAEVGEARDNVFLAKLRGVLKSGEFKSQDRVLERLLEEGFSSTDIASACLAQLQTNDPAPARPPRSRPEPERDPRDSSPARGPGMIRRDPAPHRSPVSQRDPRPHPAPRPPLRQHPNPIPSGPHPQPSPGVLRSSLSERIPLPSSITPPLPTAAQPGTPGPGQTPGELTPRPVPAPRPPLPNPRFNPTQARKPFPTPQASPAPAKPPRPEGDFTRLHMNIGSEMGIAAADILSAVAGETGLPPSVVGSIDLRERHAFLEVATPHARAIVSKLNRAQIKGRKLKMKTA